MIGSVQKAMQILTAISEGKSNPVSLAEICEVTGINKSTCSHIISTLLAEGYVQRISATKGYVLGPATYCLSRYGRYDNEFVALCHPLLRFLYKKTGQATLLAVIQGGRKFVIDYIDVEPKLLSANGSSKIHPDDIYRTATGRIMMANMGEKELRDIYEKCGPPPEGHWEEVYSWETLRKQLVGIDGRKLIKTCTIKEDGQTVSVGYAAAIYRYSKCVGALGIALECKSEIYEQFQEEEEPEIEKMLMKCRNELNRRLICQ